MRVTRRSRLQTRAQNVVFVVLLLAVLGLLAWLSTVYVGRSDWTYGHRNTLSQPSRKLVTSLSGAVQITAFATQNDELRRSIRGLVGKYERVDHKIHLKFVDPNTAPDEVRSLGITVNGEMVVSYQGRTQTVKQHTESALTNALARVARSAQRHVVFITGHGEMSPKSGGKFGLQSFAHTLKQQGFKIRTLNLTNTPKIPKNTSVLVIAGPQTDFLPGEVAIVRNYVKQGGNLLWLDNPGSKNGLAALAKQLHVALPHGTIVDATSPMFGVRDVRWLVLTQYQHSPITQGLHSETLYPGATAVDVDKNTGGWQITPFVKSRGLPRSWLETGKLQGRVEYNPKQGDQAGPLNVGVALTRPQPKPKAASSGSGHSGQEGGSKAPPSGAKAAAGAASKPSQPRGNQGSRATAKGGDPSSQPVTHGGQQRVVVMGDAYFLADAYVGTGGNQELGLNVVNWLSHDDRFINIHPTKAPDLSLNLSADTQEMIVYGFLIVLPLLLLMAGVSIWMRRRRG